MSTERENEIWKIVPGTNSTYSVSNEGRVRSEERVVPNRWSSGRVVRAKVLAQTHNRITGYLQVGLSLGAGKRMQRNVHTLVATAFIPKAQGKLLEVNHKDGNKHNNAVVNLEWVTPSHNARHARNTNLRRYSPTTTGGAHTHLTFEQAEEIRRAYAEGGITMAALGEAYGVSRVSISHILNNKVHVK